MNVSRPSAIFPTNPCIRINYQKRNPVYGLFIQDDDSDYREHKNFRRIITKTHQAHWQKTKDMRLGTIFNSAEFSRLVLSKDAFEEQMPEPSAAGSIGVPARHSKAFVLMQAGSHHFNPSNKGNSSPFSSCHNAS